MKKTVVLLYEVTKKELKDLPANTQVLVFNPFQYSYKVYPCQQLTNFSDVTNNFFLFDKE